MLWQASRRRSQLEDPDLCVEVMCTFIIPVKMSGYHDRKMTSRWWGGVGWGGVHR